MVNIESNRMYISFVLLFTIVLICTILTISSGSVLNYAEANVGTAGSMEGDGDDGGSYEEDENEISFSPTCVSGNSRCVNSEIQSGSEEEEYEAEEYEEDSGFSQANACGGESPLNIGWDNLQSQIQQAEENISFSQANTQANACSEESYWDGECQNLESQIQRTEGLNDALGSIFLK